MRQATVCRRCRKSLIRAAPVDARGSSGKIRIAAHRLPARACAGGCPGVYWGEPELGSDLFRALTGGAAWVLPRRLFGRSCPTCHERLWANSRPGRLSAVIPHPRSPSTLVEIEAPVLDCHFCGVAYLDAMGHVDSIRLALTDLLGNHLIQVAAGDIAAH